MMLTKGFFSKRKYLKNLKSLQILKVQKHLIVKFIESDEIFTLGAFNVIFKVIGDTQLLVVGESEENEVVIFIYKVSTVST